MNLKYKTGPKPTEPEFQRLLSGMHQKDDRRLILSNTHTDQGGNDRLVWTDYRHRKVAVFSAEVTKDYQEGLYDDQALFLLAFEPQSLTPTEGNERNVEVFDL